MLKKFNKLIFENAKYISSNMSSFDEIHFLKNDDNSITANFFNNVNNEKIYFIVLKMNNKLKVYLTHENGESETLSEKEFSVKYNNEYNQYKKELKKYETGELLSGTNNSNGLQSNENNDIKKFDDQLNDVDKNNNIINKIINIKGVAFNFEILKDEETSKYCQCTFTFNNNDQKSYAKILLYLKENNSIIIKILLQENENDDETKVVLPDYKFEEKYKDLYNSFKSALLSFEEYLKLKY